MTSYTVVTTANADLDIQQAIDWEDERSEGLGRHFFDKLENRLKDISSLPAMGTIRYDNVRCVKVKTFQYLVHYIVDDKHQKLIVLRVLHTSRKPAR
ncbi:MAG: type II toxin-antitoxin system RelE/ParE family toxin [Flavipsychrobacter sp.]|nr:type II toxin-antitoxin system RelE/ParE family toxin [Flavipsychrobacter sp.]